MPGTKHITKPFCTVPFAEAFSGDVSTFRNCCSVDPAITSEPGQTFVEWWHSAKFLEFKNRLYQNQWLEECRGCQFQEQHSGASFRTAVNDSVNLSQNFGIWPSRWNLKFGNVCNLACWTCNEYSSSVIAQHKKIIGILPEDFLDPEKDFQRQWPQLEKDVLASYKYHDTVTLTLLGGEPLYNKTINNFLTKLVELGLSARTKLEFHTNGTKVNSELFTKNNWDYICIFLSLDAVGDKAEWLRYGCSWKNIESNIEHFKALSDYLEVHCTLSVLNLCDLPDLKKFCKANELPLKINLLSQPSFMSLASWPGDKHKIANFDSLNNNGLSNYFDLIGTQPDPQAITALDAYINQFRAIRKSLGNDFPLLAAIKTSI